MVEISVILVAHDRKTYIHNALVSLSKQTLGAEKYEVIVVKNFADEELDRFILSLGFKNINTSKRELIAKLESGFKVSMGDIITVLEDDDIYERTRLEIILNEFYKHSIVYYHNNYWMIDEHGLLIKENKQKNNIIFNINGVESTRGLREIISFHVHHNLSSMAFDRNFFSRVVKNFPGITYSIDLLFFLEAVSTQENLFLDSRKLTYYMQHESASTTNFFDGNKIQQNANSDSETVYLLQRLINRELNPVLKDRIKLMLIERMIYINIKGYDNKVVPNVTYRQLYLFVMDKIHTFSPESYFVVFLFFLYKWFPKSARNTMQKIRKFRIGRGI